MENKTKKGLIISVSIITLVYFLYKKLHTTTFANQNLLDKIWNHMISKNLDLASKPEYKLSYQTALNNEPLGYLNAWNDSIDKNQPSFIFNLVTYNSDNGVAI